jgi:S-adenosylmethionine:tRNA ribosyltransferase-isomerase
VNLHDFDYYLPEELIAQHPIEKRDMSRLMVLDKETGEIEHNYFKDIVDYRMKVIVLFLIIPEVIPARLLGKKRYRRKKDRFVLAKKGV